MCGGMGKDMLKDKLDMEKEPSKTTHRGHYEAAKLHTFTFDGKIQ
jgi:hypothetical protein